MIPFGRRIQIRPIERKQTLVSQDAVFTEQGEVIAIGDEVSTFVQIGDIVLFTSFGLDAVEIDEEKYYFIIEDDSFLLAKI